MTRSMFRTMLFAGFVAALSACDEDSSTGPKSNASPDAIAIKNIAVLIPMDFDSTITYRIDYEYTLVSLDSAEVGFGFNSGDDINAFIGSPGFDTIVTKGTKSASLTVSTSYKSWGARGRFQCQGTMSDPHHGIAWNPIAVTKELEAPAQ